MSLIIVALGANLPSRFGSPAQTLDKACVRMNALGVKIIKRSRTWITAPVPISDQPWYHNEIVSVDTSLSSYELLEQLQTIEKEFGRVRTIRNAPRVLDLDLIAYNDEVLSKPELIVPHPRMHQRAFVLLPLRDVVKQWHHPTLHVSLDDLISNLPKDQKAIPLEHAEKVTA